MIKSVLKQVGIIMAAVTFTVVFVLAYLRLFVWLCELTDI